MKPVCCIQEASLLHCKGMENSVKSANTVEVQSVQSSDDIYGY